MNEKSIIFYGKNWTPLSNECYGCYHYGTICGGSVTMQECGAGIVQDMKPSLAAYSILSKENNRFIVARVFGYDIANEVDINDLHDNKLVEEFKAALETPIEVIEEYQKMYSIDCSLD